MSAENICRSALNWIIEVIFNSKKHDRQFYIGIGSGSTIIPFVKLLSDFIISNQNGLSITCIPTSEQARHLILNYLKLNKSFRLGTLNECERIDVTVDGADSVYFTNKFVVKGCGAAHCQEKLVAESSDNYIIVIADRKKIEKSIEEVVIPVEVLNIASVAVGKKLKKEFGNDLTSCEIRVCPSGCGKIGPIITDNGNLILDLKFSKMSQLFNSPQRLDYRIRQFAGVIETGVFWRLPENSLIIFPDNNEQINQKML